MQWWNGSDEPIADGAVWAALGSELPVGGCPYVFRQALGADLGW